MDSQLTLKPACVFGLVIAYVIYYNEHSTNLLLIPTHRTRVKAEAHIALVRVDLVAELTCDVAVDGWTSCSWTLELARMLTPEVVHVPFTSAVCELLAGLRLAVEVPAHGHHFTRPGIGRHTEEVTIAI